MNKSLNFIVLIFLLLSSRSYAFEPEQNNKNSDDNSAFLQQLEQYPFPDDISGKPSRFVFLRKLLEVSSGAKKVMSSENEDSHQAYFEARKTYIKAAEEPDNTVVNALLDQTVKLMYKAIQLASSKQLLDQKKERDYKRKLLSVNALLEALERIAVEKNNVDVTHKLKTNISGILQSAEKLINEHQVDQARELLDEAYLLTKTGIENMRSGDVLVRELKFESIEEEYAYELDRNDTHKMLIKMLIEKKLADKPEAFKNKINGFVDDANKIREQAEGLANQEDYKGAIAELEKSTKVLVQAIRMGGVFIPG